MEDIRYDVPLPKAVKKKTKYNFNEFDVDGFKHYTDVKIGTLNSCLVYARKTNKVPVDWVFSIRKFNYEGKDGVGVWRVK